MGWGEPREAPSIMLGDYFFDLDEARHFYSTISTVTTQTAFNELSNKYKTSSYATARVPTQQTFLTTYKVR